MYFASEDLYFFVMDTLTFENASSLGHLIEWFEGLESMIEFPRGDRPGHEWKWEWRR